MASMNIPNESLNQRLRLRAATHGRSMDDEARDILGAALAETIIARLQPVGGVELERLREDIGVETDHRPKSAARLHTSNPKASEEQQLVATRIRWQGG